MAKLLEVGANPKYGTPPGTITLPDSVLLPDGRVVDWNVYLNWALEHAGDPTATLDRGLVKAIDPETNSPVDWSYYRAKYFIPSLSRKADTEYKELRPHPLGAGMSESLTGVSPLQRVSAAPWKLDEGITGGAGAEAPRETPLGRILETTQKTTKQYWPLIVIAGLFILAWIFGPRLVRD